MTPQYTLQKLQSEFPSVKITDSKSSADFVRQFYQGDIGIFESSFILLLNSSLKTIGWAKIGQGGIVGTVVDPIIVAKYAVSSLAKSVILVHNHPSGSLKPSSADVSITDKIKKGLAFLDITLVDHIIITETDYTSMADKGLL